jgi:hypothetical protein
MRHRKPSEIRIPKKCSICRKHGTFKSHTGLRPPDQGALWEGTKMDPSSLIGAPLGLGLLLALGGLIVVMNYLSH